MRINYNVVIGEYIGLYRDSGGGPDGPARPMLSVCWRGRAVAVPLAEEVRLALIEALQHPDDWPLHYETPGRAR